MEATIVNRGELVVAPCREACPVNIDVPRYIRCVKEGNFAEALAVVREKLPLPTVCSDACFAPCELACAYKQFGSPIAIRALKRSAVDQGGDSWKRKKKLVAKTGKKIAIVGAGPAGLTAAYYLATLGHKVTLYDRFPKPGGTMRYGIPRYRIPEARLDKDIQEILALGVEFRSGVTLGKEVSMDTLKQENNAVFLAVGSTESARINIGGLDKSGIFWALEFLCDVASGKVSSLRGEVVVVGGGNVAIDAALTARRLGAKKVSLVCLEKREEMPAHEWEIARAEEEGVVIHNGWGPQEIKGKNTVTGLELKKCISVFDRSHKFSPRYDETATMSLPARYVIFAVGQRAELGFWPNKTGLDSARGTIKVNDVTLATSESGVFAGGDAVSGPTSVIEAIAQGRKAALSIDRFLGGKGTIDETLAGAEETVVLPELCVQVKPRAEMPFLNLGERQVGFEQIERGFTEKQAVAEAKRCLVCDARRFEVTVYPENCKECGYCQEACGLGIFTSADVFNKKGYRPAQVKSSDKCVGCLKCFYTCPDFAIDVTEQTGVPAGGV